MRLDTRGYKYELVQPIPVTVMEGRIRGVRQTPYKEMMPKPGVDYSDTPEDPATDAGTAGPAPATAPTTGPAAGP
jgi:hypothetical protein